MTLSANSMQIWGGGSCKDPFRAQLKDYALAEQFDWLECTVQIRHMLRTHQNNPMNQNLWPEVQPEREQRSIAKLLCGTFDGITAISGNQSGDQ